MSLQRPGNIPEPIAGILYPEVQPPSELMTLADQVDFLVRLCAAADFGVLPWPETCRRYSNRPGGPQ